MIATLAADYSIRELCTTLGVSRSGYYAWRAGGRGHRAKANATLGKQIIAVHRESRGVYGSPRITRALRTGGVPCSRNRVARLMRQLGVRGVQRGRFRPKTTLSRHDGVIAPNRMAPGLNVRRPHQLWAADITYIPTLEGWAYLAAFMDMGSRAICGWALMNSMRAELVTRAFDQAVRRHQPVPGLVVHSDRGIQFASTAFRQQLERYGALPSMSRTGNCYDNAAMESFWATLKSELRMNKPFKNQEEARLAIFDYIETFYNRTRLHSALGYQTPLDYETNYNQQN